MVSLIIHRLKVPPQQPSYVILFVSLLLVDPIRPKLRFPLSPLRRERRRKRRRRRIKTRQSGQTDSLNNVGTGYHVSDTSHNGSDEDYRTYDGGISSSSIGVRWFK